MSTLEKVSATAFEELPTVKKILARVHIEEVEHGVIHFYQGVEMLKYKEALEFFKAHKNDYTESVVACMRDRVKVQHQTLMTDVLLLLATQGWERPEMSELAEAAIDRLILTYEVPLVKAGIDPLLIKAEWTDLTEYGKQYLLFVKDGYRSNWWKLFNASDAPKWSNILGLIELLFCIPASNGHLERVFSTLKLIKTDRRNLLGENCLDNLLRIAVDCPPLAQWDAIPAVRLWWKDKQRRQPTHDTRAPPTFKTTSAVTVSEPEPAYTFSLEDWDTFIEDYVNNA